MNSQRLEAVAVLLLGALLAAPGAVPAADPAIVVLTQTACQFIESENGTEHGFGTRAKSDCEAVNARTGAARLAAAKTITLPPGRYVFRVANRDVPYALGFWLRGDGLIEQVRLPSVSGGGLVAGTSRDYVIDLVLEYVYSCPLNPTPDYKLLVKG